MLPLVNVEMEAGDALFFHSNLLHRSDQNNSDYRRWAFLIAYSKASNLPVNYHHISWCTQINKVNLDLVSVEYFQSFNFK